MKLYAFFYFQPNRNCSVGELFMTLWLYMIMVFVTQPYTSPESQNPALPPLLTGLRGMATLY